MDNNDTQPPVVQDTQTPEIADTPAPQSDDDEWAGAIAGYAMDKGAITPGEPIETGGKDDTSDAGEGDGADDQGTGQGSNSDAAHAEGDGQKPVQSNDDAEGEGAGDTGDQAPLTRAEIESERKEVMADVRKELYADLPEQLTDADGDPIRTIEDVQKLINPNTRQQFTEEEAAAWLLAAQQHLNTQRQEAEQRVEKVAETILSLKDQTNNVFKRYGDLLEANPDGIREKVWKAYEKTLIKDETTGVIVDAPVSLEEFYETVLSPYERQAAQMEANEAAGHQQQAQQQRQQVAKQKSQAQSDRQDIIGGGKTNTKDPEEAEWEKAAKAYYEG